jgi:hypothetical protein
MREGLFHISHQPRGPHQNPTCFDVGEIVLSQ